jgi:hypothetical protein
MKLKTRELDDLAKDFIIAVSKVELTGKSEQFPIDEDQIFIIKISSEGYQTGWKEDFPITEEVKKDLELIVKVISMKAISIMKLIGGKDNENDRN